nr:MULTISPECIES: glycosyltransferase family A protein [Burkholderia]
MPPADGRADRLVGRAVGRRRSRGRTALRCRRCDMRIVGRRDGGADRPRAAVHFARAQRVDVQIERHVPAIGLAEQRAFLLAHARAPRCLFVDDDVMLEPDLVARLVRALDEQRCGFVGSALHGLSYVDDVRTHQQAIEFWDGRVMPEVLTPGGDGWSRHHLHSAANLYHVQCRLCVPRDASRVYRVAWVGGCVLFDTAKLRAAGGFEFWRALPRHHCGEDVLAQLRVMARFGGCGLFPSGAYHAELATTVPEREVDAPFVLSHLIDEAAHARG